MQTEFETDTEVEVEEPKMYKVLLHNDDHTSMEFVVGILKGIFHKTHEEAEKLTLRIHKKGFAICGIYIDEIARTKVRQVQDRARENDFPLKSTTEEI